MTAHAFRRIAMWFRRRPHVNAANPHAEATTKPLPAQLADPPMIDGETLRNYALHHAHPRQPLTWDSQRLGVWADITESMYDYVLADPLVAHHFADRRGEGLRELKRHFLSALVTLTQVGLTCETAERLRRVHAHLHITAAEFDAVTGHLVHALQDHLHPRVVNEALPQLTPAVSALRARLVT